MGTRALRLAAAVLVTSSPVVAEPDLPSTHSPRTTLRLNVYPSFAHVYVDDVRGMRLTLLCTGWCTLEPSAGVYRIRGGFTHAELGEADQRVLITAGVHRTLRVDVEPRLGAALIPLMFVGVGALTALTSATVGYATRGPGDPPRYDSVPALVSYSGIAVMFLGLSLRLVLEPELPRVKVVPLEGST